MGNPKLEDFEIPTGESGNPAAKPPKKKRETAKTKATPRIKGSIHKRRRAKKSEEEKPEYLFRVKGFRIHPSAIEQLENLSMEHNTTEKALIAEALNLLFAKFDKPQVA